MRDGVTPIPSPLRPSMEDAWQTFQLPLFSCSCNASCRHQAGGEGRALLGEREGERGRPLSPSSWELQNCAPNISLLLLHPQADLTQGLAARGQKALQDGQASRNITKTIAWKKYTSPRVQWHRVQQLPPEKSSAQSPCICFQ